MFYGRGLCQIYSVEKSRKIYFFLQIFSPLLYNVAMLLSFKNAKFRRTLPARKKDTAFLVLKKFENLSVRNTLMWP